MRSNKNSERLLPAHMANGLNGHCYAEVAASWRECSLRQIAHYEHLPIVQHGIPVPMPDTHAKLAEALGSFRFECSNLFTERNGSFSLSRAEIGRLFGSLREAALQLPDASSGSASMLVTAIDEASRFLTTRGGWAQNQWFIEITSRVINEGYLALHGAAGTLSNDDLIRHRAHVEYPGYMRTYEIARRDGLLSALESAVDRRASKEELLSIVEAVSRRWMHHDNSCVYGIGRDPKFADAFDLTKDTLKGKWRGQGARHIEPLEAARLLTRILRAEFDWERWNTPNAMWGDAQQEEELTAKLESRTLESLYLKRPRDEDHTVWMSYLWVIEISLSMRSPEAKLSSIAKQVESRNERLMPRGDLLHYTHVDDFGAATAGVLNEIVAIQTERQAKPRGTEPVNGMLRIYEKQELTAALQRGSEICALKVGKRMLNFSLFAPRLAHASGLGRETADDKLAEPTQQQYYLDLVVQRRGSTSLACDQYAAPTPYGLLDGIVIGALRVHHRGAALRGSAVVRTAPNPNTSIAAHEEQGWQRDGQSIERKPFKFEVLRRSEPEASHISAPTFHDRQA
jgi:hypothetical protein